MTEPAPAWITPQDVALYADRVYPSGDSAMDGRIDGATFAVKAAIEERRSDLDFSDRALVPENVRQGSIYWAAQLFQTRNAPSGYAGYGDETSLYDALGARRAEILRLVGWRRPGLF